MEPVRLFGCNHTFEHDQICVFRGFTMESDFESSAVRYAVIEAMCSEGPPEFFVIPYRTERSLRLVIADFCIVGTGFSSRDEALEVCQSQLCSAA